MKTKKRIFLLAFSALIFGSVQTVNAQVTIGGETEPVKGATLDLSPENGYIGGLKLPNVELTSLTAIPASFTDAGSVTATKLKGLQVYNTITDASKGLAEGVYIWNGSRWTQDGIKQNLIYDITFAHTATSANTETELATFTLEPGLYLWNLGMCCVFTDGTVLGKYCSYYLRNKTTGAKLVQIYNETIAAAYISVYKSYVFSIAATTTVSLSVYPSMAGYVPAVTESHGCQIVKLN